MIDTWLNDAETRMGKSIEALHKELATIRTGRATPALVERLQVEYYGAPTPLQSLASITAPEARLLVIQPYDRNAIAVIEKAIQKSELGLNPANDGQLIRIPVPQLTEERRRDFVKLVRKHAEEARVAIRNIRRDEVEHVRRMERDGEAGRDEVEKAQTQIQKITDRFIAQVDEVAHKKEAEILEV
jgi:ribosome recycling factor